MGETARVGIRSSPAKSEMSFSSSTKPLGSEKAPQICVWRKDYWPIRGLALKEENQGSYVKT